MSFSLLAARLRWSVRSFAKAREPISRRVYELHNPNIVKIRLPFTPHRMIQSCHNFAHVPTAQLSWHAQNCDLIGSLESKLVVPEFSQNFNYELINPLLDRSQHCRPISRVTRKPSSPLWGLGRAPIREGSHNGGALSCACDRLWKPMLVFYHRAVSTTGSGVEDTSNICNSRTKRAAHTMITAWPHD